MQPQKKGGIDESRMILVFLAVITLGDGTLTRDLDGDFLETLDVLDLINDGHQDLQTGFQSPMESTHPLNDPCFLLRNKLDNLYIYYFYLALVECM
jgi:hypothetical protein